MNRNALSFLTPNKFSKGLGSLKRNYLLFDEIAVLGVDDFLSAHRNSIYGTPEVADDLEMLLGSGILSKVHDDFLGSDLSKLVDYASKDSNFFRIMNEFAAVGARRNKISERILEEGGSSQEANEHLEANWQLEELREKLYAEYLSANSSDVYAPLFGPRTTTGVVSQSEVVNIVISNFPLLDDALDWKILFDFKRDGETKLKLLRFRDLTNRLASQQLEPIGVKEEIEHLVEEYKKHVELAGLKYKQGTLEGVFLSSLMFVENLIRLRPSRAFGALYSMKRRKIELLEAINDAPGKEVSLLVGAMNLK